LAIIGVDQPTKLVIRWGLFKITEITKLFIYNGKEH